MDYYQLLGVHHTASAAEIRQAYRKLAIRYHPDKNNDPGVEGLFKQITAAYNVLSDPERRRAYDLRNLYGYEPATPQRTHRDPAYRPQQNRPRRKNERERLRDLMAKYLPYTQKISILSFAVSICLLVDYVLPRSVTREEIVNVQIRQINVRNGTISSWIIFTDGGHRVELPIEESTYFKKGTSVAVRASLLFGVVTRLIAPDQDFSPRKTIYGNFIFLPAALLILSGFGVLRRKEIELGFNLGVVNFIVLLFMIIILLII
jgi:hypothetical protein